ncbi:MAG: hypothetical protein C5B49_12565 [Bdellovibrio sp.]|nr:MAG: hypothetical protein C5B49_12565 [Bdellovibrio sp.]
MKLDLFVVRISARSEDLNRVLAIVSFTGGASLAVFLSLDQFQRHRFCLRAGGGSLEFSLYRIKLSAGLNWLASLNGWVSFAAAWTLTWTYSSISILLFSSLSQAADWPRVYEEIKPSVPILVTNGGYCSASLIERNLVLTAAHCVDTLREISFTWPAQFGEFSGGKLVAMDKETDLALVRLDTPRAEKPIPLIAKDKKVRPGDAVATIGHPSMPDFHWETKYPFKKDETYLISTGVVSGVGEDDLITDMSLTPGNSGGPILNSDGEIVGVVSRKRVGPAVGFIGFATQRQKIYDFLDQYKKSGDEEIPWWRAKTSLEAGINFMDGTLAETDRNSRFFNTDIELRLALFDRFYLGWSESLNTQPHLISWMVGPKFQWDTRSRHVWIVAPLVEYSHLKYQPDGGSGDVFEDFWNYSLLFRNSRFPLAFKFSVAPRHGRTEYFWSLQLPLF